MNKDENRNEKKRRLAKIRQQRWREKQTLEQLRYMNKNIQRLKEKLEKSPTKFSLQHKVARAKANRKYYIKRMALRNAASSTQTIIDEPIIDENSIVEHNGGTTVGINLKQPVFTHDADIPIKEEIEEGPYEMTENTNVPVLFTDPLKEGIEEVCLQKTEGLNLPIHFATNEVVNSSSVDAHCSYVLLNAKSSNLTDVQKLLVSWGLENIIKKFTTVTLNTLRYMTEIELQSFFPGQNEINEKCEFRRNLIKWRQENGYQVSVPTLSESLSFNSSLLTWTEQSNFSIPSSSPSHSVNSVVNDSNFILKDFLQTEKGKKITEMCGEDHILTNVAREILISNIVQFFIEKNKCMRPSDFLKINQDIVDLYPQENPDYYYKGGKRPSGKLYNKYRNSSANLRKVGYFKAGKTLKLSEEVEILDSDDLYIDHELSSNCLEQDKIWLQVSHEPWFTVEIKWKNTFKLRKQKENIEDCNTVQFLKEWPILKTTNGFRLIDIDFECMFKNKSLSLKNKWQTFVDKAPQIFKEHLKKPKTQKKLCDLSTNADTHNYQILRLLHSVLPPSGRVSQTKGDRKGFWKPSIEDSLGAFFLELENAGELQKKIDEKRRSYQELGWTLQPLIIVFKNLETKKYAVSFDDIFYSFDSVVACIDICFKLFFVLNLKFPLQCKNVWQFIQKYFYEIDKSFDGCINSNILLLISEFKKNT